MSKGSRFWASLLVLFCIATSLVYAAVRLISRESTITVQIRKPPTFLDPARLSSYEEKLISGNLYETLVRYNPENQIAQGGLAEKWEANREGCVYTFFLQKGLKFHNGELVTAQDVKLSWERVLDPCLSDYGYLLQNVVGAENKLKGMASNTKGLEVIDPYTFRVSLKEPDWTFPALVSSPALAVVNAKTVQKYGRAYGKPGSPIVGTGPFCLGRWGAREVSLRRNWHYYREKPRTRRVDFLVLEKSHKVRHLFETGKVDILAGVSAQFALAFKEKKVNPEITVVEKPILTTYFLGFNLDQAPFGKSRALREAVNTTLDKKMLTEELLGEGGKILAGFLPPEVLPPKGGSLSMRKVITGRVEALRILAKAGYPYGSKLPPLTFVYNKSPGHESLARVLQEQLGQVGIDLCIKKIPWQKYQAELQEGVYPFFRLGWEADYPEPGNFLYSNFYSKERGRNNYTGYLNSTFDTLIRAARSEKDAARRTKIYQEAEALISADVPVIPLFQQVAIFILQKDIANFEVDLLGIIDFSRVYKNFIPLGWYKKPMLVNEHRFLFWFGSAC